MRVPRSVPGLALGLAALLLVAGPLTQAQQPHAHGNGQAMVVIAHDASPDGRAVAGNVAHFAAVLFGADGTPQFHHNMRIEVRENGVLLWSTTGDSGHDYDGVNGFDVVFPVPGTYEVTATTAGRDGELTGSFTGHVVNAAGAQPASLQLTIPGGLAAGLPADVGYSITDAKGQPIPHTDAVFEVRKEGALEFRVHTHGHQGPQALSYAFPSVGTHTVSIVAYTAFPTAKSPVFDAFTVTKQVEVGPALPTTDLGVEAAALVPTLPGTEMNAVTMGTSQGEDYVVMTTYDPYTSVGPFSQVRLSTLVVNATTMQPVQHVNFEAQLTDALGHVLFRSSSLHEYDGILEVLVGDQLPGQYHLAVQASQGAWKGNASASYQVLPPVEALSAGPQEVDVLGLDQAQSGSPTQVTLFAHDLAGMPFAHSEVDVQIVPKADGAPPLVATKLHTHDDGKFLFNVTFPGAGDYVLRLAPFSLEARPTPIYLGPNMGPLDVPVKVAAGAALPASQAEPLNAASSPAPAKATPGPEGALLFVALSMLALARRR